MGSSNGQSLRCAVLAALLLIGCGKSPHHADDSDDDSPSQRDGGAGASSGKGHRRDAGNSDSGSNRSDAARPDEQRGDGGRAGDDASPNGEPAQAGEDAATCASGDCIDAAAPSECTDVAQPTVLFVYDRSGSMSSDWIGKTRTDGVHDAVVSALTPLASELTIGALFFPSVDPDAPLMCADPTGIACMFTPGLLLPSGMCDVNAIGEPDQLDLRGGDEFLAALGEADATHPARYAPIPGGQTPLLGALQGAQKALDDAGLGAGTTVIIITDGDPNCMWDAIAARTVIDGWLAAGIELYFIAIPNMVGMTTTMSLLASSGPNPTIVEPADPAELEQDLTDILSSRTSPPPACP